MLPNICCATLFKADICVATCGGQLSLRQSVNKEYLLRWEYHTSLISKEEKWGASPSQFDPFALIWSSITSFISTIINLLISEPKNSGQQYTQQVNPGGVNNGHAEL